MTKAKLAGILGVVISLTLFTGLLLTPQVLGQAPQTPKERFSALLTELAQEGTITAEQARIISERSSPIFEGMAGTPSSPGHQPHDIDHQAILLKVSQILGLKLEELVAQLKQGKTIAELAQAQGMSLEALVIQLTAEDEAELRGKVAEGQLTLEQAERQLKQWRQKLLRWLADLRLNTAGLSLEMHWGFIDRLSGATNNTSLFMPMAGKISISDSNDTTEEGLHLISALLFEEGGAWEAGQADGISLPPYWSPSVEWRSATTDDWDGIAVNFRWQKGTNPLITIQTEQWSRQLLATELKELLKTPQIIDLGRQGQKLEIGQFFSLSYRVYDMQLEWGYDPENDADPHDPPRLTVWDGSLSLSQGGIRLLKTLSFEQGGDYSQGRDDRVLTYTDLGPALVWRSSTIDPLRKRKEVDGLAVNYVVPRGVEAAVTLSFKEYGQETITLPHRFQDKHWERTVDDYGHYIHAHLHWCWFKASPGPGATGH